MYERNIIGRFGYSISERELEYLGTNGIGRDETKSEFYWHPIYLLVEHHWGNVYKVHPQEVVNEMNRVINYNRAYACMQADYGNWEPTQRINAIKELIAKIDIHCKLESF